MMPKRKLRVLVVDDSLLFRETIARGLARDDGLEIVGTAADPFVARDMIISLEPDVLTLDVEMPRMSGIDFLKKLMPQHPLPVVVVSSVSSNVFDAMSAGAVDFVTKPGPGSVNGMENLIRELGVKIKIASTAKVGQNKTAAAIRPDPIQPSTTTSRADHGLDLIVIGASTGGTEAVCNILKKLPRDLPRDLPPIVIVQHMPPVFTRLFAERLNNCCPLLVREALDGAEIKPGEAWVAAGDCHLAIKPRGRALALESKPGDRVNGHCPSVDVLFNAAADLQQKGRHTLGLILTGMGYDGAKGLLAMRKAGAVTLGQDEETSIVYGMPKVAWDIGAVNRQLPLEKIAGEVLSLL